MARPYILLCLLVFFSLPVMHVWASKGDVVGIGKEVGEPLRITLGKAELVRVDGDVADVMVANSEIINVQAVQSDKLYIVGTGVGDTNLIVLDSAGEVIQQIDVHVSYDLKAINSFLKKAYPEEDVTVDVLHDQIMLMGSVSTPEMASIITNVVGSYAGDVQDDDGEPDELITNLVRVRGEQQVMLQVRILEASRSFVRDLGLNTVTNDLDENAAALVFGGFPPTSSRGGDLSVGNTVGDGVALPNDPASTLRFLLDTAVPGVGTLGMFLSALEREDLVSILAEPNLTTISGQQAGFLAGGEFPVPVGRDQVGNLVIEFREFGVSLNFRPVVMSADRISMQLNAEVSSLDFVNSVGAGDLVIPGLDIRRTDTTVELPSGGTMMISGLLQSDTVEGLAGLPGIRKAPVIGDLISSKAFERNETELVVLVSAYLVEPHADKSRAEEVPKQRNNPLAQSFAINLRNRFDRVDEDIFYSDQVYGYLLD